MQGGAELKNQTKKIMAIEIKNSFGFLIKKICLAAFFETAKNLPKLCSFLSKLKGTNTILIYKP